MEFGFEYFCGANVVVEIEGMPIAEAAGLRVSMMESKRPVYGYSSRHYDGVASGQVLVEGALLLNYVDQNYLFRAIEMGLEDTGQAFVIEEAATLSSELQNQLSNESAGEALLREYILDPARNKEISDAFKEKFWNPQISVITGTPVLTPNPHDIFGGVDIVVTFGTREIYNFNSGKTSRLIQDVHFVGRSQALVINGEVIGEEFPFFARNMIHIRQPYTLEQEEATVEGRPEDVTSLGPPTNIS